MAPEHRLQENGRTLVPLHTHRSIQWYLLFNKYNFTSGTSLPDPFKPLNITATTYTTTDNSSVTILDR